MPRYDRRGLLPLVFLLGLALGAVLVNIIDPLAEYLVSRWPVGGVVAVLHLVALPFFVAGIGIGVVAAARRLFVFAALLMNLGLFLAVEAWSISMRPGFGAERVNSTEGVGVLLAFGVTSLVSLAVMLAGRWMAHRLMGFPIEQTDPPRYCQRCAYERGGCDPCPECGVFAMDARMRWRWYFALVRGLQRGAMPVLVLVVVASIGYSAWRMHADYLPTRRFIARFGQEPDAYSYIDLVDEVRPGVGLLHNSTGRTFELGDGSGRMILVSFHSRPPRNLPVMQVRICAAATLPPGWPVGAERMTDWGLPNTIVADLNREQAERVIREGLPRGLIDAIVAKADEIGWKAGGGMQNVGGARLVIDAEPHFADGKKQE